MTSKTDQAAGPIPALSVIVPVYNVEAWLPRCLDSLCNQSFRDLEIICVNDGSTDGSAAILEAYAARDPRIRVIHQENGGLSAARNSGLAACRAELVTTVDSDDYIETDTYAELLPHMTEDIDLICYGVAVEAPALPWAEKMQRYFSMPSEQEVEITPERAVSVNDTAWNKIYRRSLIERFNLRYPHGIWYEDFCFTQMYLSVSRRMYLNPRRFYHYVLRGDSIMGQTQQRSSAKALDRLPSMGAVLDFYRRHSLTERFRPVISHWLHQLPAMLRQLPPDHVGRGKRQSREFLRQQGLDRLFAGHDTVQSLLHPVRHALSTLFYRDKETSTQFRLLGLPLFSLMKRRHRRRYRLLGIGFGPKIP